MGRIPTWDVADKLVKARTSAGFSQTELAEAMGVGRATVARAEQGVAKPRRPVFLAWAFATGVDLDWLMSTDEPTPDDGCPQQGSNLRPAD